MLYKVSYGLTGESYEKDIEVSNDYQAYLSASKILFDLITFREISNGAYMKVEKINET